MIEHIYEYEKVLKEFKRILKKDGCLIITFPNETLWTFARFLLGRKPVKVPDHVNSFTPEKIRRAAGMRLASKANLPLGLPFIVSFGCMMKFIKED